MIELWKRRSSISLVGNVINVQNGNVIDIIPVAKFSTGQWIRADSSIGAGIDSFFEYLLKAYVLFGDQEMYDVFVQVSISGQCNS